MKRFELNFNEDKVNDVLDKNGTSYDLKGCCKLLNEQQADLNYLSKFIGEFKVEEFKSKLRNLRILEDKVKQQDTINKKNELLKEKNVINIFDIDTVFHNCCNDNVNLVTKIKKQKDEINYWKNKYNNTFEIDKETIKKIKKIEKEMERLFKEMKQPITINLTKEDENELRKLLGLVDE